MKKAIGLFELIFVIVIILVIYFALGQGKSENPISKYINETKTINQEKTNINLKIKEIENAKEIQNRLQMQMENEGF